MATIDDLLRAHVADQPGALAAVDPSRRATWAELDGEVDGLASALAERGVGAGDVVGLQAPNSVDLVAAFLAVVRLGAVVTPFPVQYREYELEQLGKRTNAVGMVTTDELAGRSVGVGGWQLLLDDGAAPTGTVPRREADPAERVTVCWTSGTESTPKGVPRAHTDWLAMARATVDGAALIGDDVVLNPFPMVNMAGIGGMLLPWLVVGCTLVQHQPFDLPLFLRQVAEERVTYTVAPPALLTMLLQHEEALAGTDISSLRRVGSGSAPLPPAMVKGWQERHGIPVINFFGSNEGVALLSDPVTIPDPEQRARFFPRPTLPGVEIRLVDPGTGTEVTAPGRPAELRIAGPTVFAGYLDGDAQPFDDDGFFRTGDLFEWADEERTLLRYVDRLKDLVIRGGMNIAPAEIESLLAAHPAVAEVAVVGVPDDVLGEKVCAVVVAKPEQTITLDDLVAHLRGLRIASYKLPERLEVVEALPRNPVGKVLKRELREQLGGPR
jgi:acyl-CoA synthetase (AMP-forming)/AMP-acid ligase II